MARSRAHSLGESLKAPHTVSLKVLRLTRPSLTQQFPLPQSQSSVGISSTYSQLPFPSFASEAALAYPHPHPETLSETAPFILTPLLTLPESFQSAYVGELFSCTLCANNELSVEESKTRMISGVRIGAEIISPSNPGGSAIEFQPSPPAFNGETGAAAKGFGSGDSIQKILKLNLQEEGEHTLAVTVTYTETTLKGAGEGRASVAAGGRVRTFRKLYQFIASSLISVRTKAGDMSGGRYALEAQLENLGGFGVVLESVRMTAKAPFKASSLNWDVTDDGSAGHPPLLNPRDIIQVAFVLEEIKGDETVKEPASSPPQKSQHRHSESGGGSDSRFILGQLNVQWRSATDRGSITTGYLTGRKR